MGKIRENAQHSVTHGAAQDTKHHRAASSRRGAIGELLSHAPKKRRMALYLGMVVLFVAGALTAVFTFTDLRWSDLPHLIDWSRVTRAIDRLNPIAVIPLMAILPIFGFPVSVVYLVAGARFGPVWGGVVVTVSTAVHLVGSYAIARSMLRRPVLRWVEKRHKRLPEIPVDEHALVALIVALVPGLPYIVRLYLLGLADIRLNIYFWICLGVFTLRSYVTILLGDLSSEPSGRRLVILGGIEALKIAICALVIWRLRVHHRRYHPPAGAAVPSTNAAKP
jgi:uncharacterized membrane protein YdjX (TVP38/TMEM64 family)